MIQTILFDSDGVLVDTERLFFEATQEVFAGFGAVIPPDQWAVWYLAESRRSREVAGLLGIPDSQVEAVIKHRDQLFWAKVEAGVSLLPGVRETLNHLSGNFRLAVVTGASRSHFEGVHAATELMDFFEVIITADDYDEPKPSPQCYQKAMHVLSVNPKECLAVEDSPRGAAAAISAGVRCAVIPTPLTNISLCPGECDILSSMTELPLFTSNYR
ncbi:MAG: HAD family phosphatase [Desulfobacteraceae bacterium]|nr:MAG: HAD family phosphatase [Desulfobacteraceae bacterium]